MFLLVKFEFLPSLFLLLNIPFLVRDEILLVLLLRQDINEMFLFMSLLEMEVELEFLSIIK